MSRVYSRLIELGVLTPEEGIRVFETGRMPDSDESIKSQKKFKELRDSGYYQPLVGGGSPATESEKVENSKTSAKNSQTTSDTVGRPSGSSGIKQSVTRSASAQTHKADEKLFFSCLKMKDVLAKITTIEKSIERKLKNKFSIKRLDANQKSVASEIAFRIFTNEEMKNWDSLVDEYINDPGREENSDQLKEIDDLAAKFSLEERSACILYHSKQ